MVIQPVDFSISRRKEEVAQKLAAVRQVMRQNGLEGVVLSKHPNFSWITAGGKNFVASCFDVGATTILITPDKCYALCSIIEAPRMKMEERLEELGFEMSVFGWEQDETHKRILELANPEKTVSDVAANGWRDANDLLRPLRAKLCEDEIARYHYLGDAMSYALESCLMTVKPGMTEWEIAGGLSAAVWQYEVEPVMLLVTADKRSYHFRHGLPTENRLEKSLVVSVNGRYKGLIATVSRMIHIGAPAEEIAERYDACLDIECRAIAKMKVGANESEAYRTLRQEYARHGYGEMFDRHGQGGCQGYFPREYMITAGRDHTIEADHAYCFNPVIDGAKTEDPFIVRQSGVEFITKPVIFPKKTLQVEGFSFERPDIMVL